MIRATKHELVCYMGKLLDDRASPWNGVLDARRVDVFVAVARKL
jgi:hypothetical protein